MILMLSTDLNHIKQVYGKDVSIATSIVSAEIQLKRNKYSLVIKDNIDYDIQNVKCITYDEYVKEHIKSDEVKPKEMKSKEVLSTLGVFNTLKVKNPVKTKTRGILQAGSSVCMVGKRRHRQNHAG